MHCFGGTLAWTMLNSLFVNVLFITDVDVVHILPYSLVLKYFTHVFRKPRYSRSKELLIFVTIDIWGNIIKYIFKYCQCVNKTLFYVFTKHYVNWLTAFLNLFLIRKIMWFLHWWTSCLLIVFVKDCWALSCLLIG